MTASLPRNGDEDLAALDPADRQRVHEALAQLGRFRPRPPPDFAARVMRALPDRPDAVRLERLAAFWPDRGRWVLPAMAGAAAAALVAAAGIWVQAVSGGIAPGSILVTFEAHAPDAQRVELVGSFNDWTPGAAVMKGPDATGRWTLQLRLAPGRHEYQFFVDGRTWQTDPQAPLRRPDGFGHDNAVLDL